MKGFVFLFLFFFGLNSWAATPKHYVFLVHGIGAGTWTYDNVKIGLLEESKRLDPATDWQFLPFAYETGSDTKDVRVFSRELGDFIANKFKANRGLNPEDKFSLVLHSQGGLIGLELVLRSFMGDPLYHPELKDHLDAFVTMATPYWGAKIAIFAKRMLPILSYLHIPFVDNFGDLELQDMELTSDFSVEMRKSLIDLKNQELIRKIKKQARFLVFSGVTEGLNSLTPIVTGKDIYEDDTAVPLPSSRMDFIYYIDSDLPHTNVTWPSEFKETNFISPQNYIVVNALHVSPFTSSSKFPDIVRIPEKCMRETFKDCPHPTYPSLVEHLFKLERTQVRTKPIASFGIDFKLNIKGFSIDRSKLSLSFNPMTAGVKIGKDSELYNRVERWNKNGDFRLYHTGYIDPKQAVSSSGKVEMIVRLPGFKERTVVVPVKPAMSSYVELNLEKE